MGKPGRPGGMMQRVVVLDDGLTCDDAEHDQRQAACRQMMERWGIQLSR